MNEELQKALAELLGKANGGIDAAGAFLTSELPDVIQQLLMWHAVYNFILFVISFISTLVAVVLLIKVFSNLKDKNHWAINDDENDLSVIGGLACVCSFLLIFLSYFCVNVQWLQIWIAPKVWLIEYVSKLSS